MTNMFSLMALLALSVNSVQEKLKMFEDFYRTYTKGISHFQLYRYLFFFSYNGMIYVCEKVRKSPCAMTKKTEELVLLSPPRSWSTA